MSAPSIESAGSVTTVENETSDYEKGNVSSSLIRYQLRYGELLSDRALAKKLGCDRSRIQSERESMEMPTYHERMEARVVGDPYFLETPAYRLAKRYGISQDWARRLKYGTVRARDRVPEVDSEDHKELDRLINEVWR